MPQVREGFNQKSFLMHQIRRGQENKNVAHASSEMTLNYSDRTMHSVWKDFQLPWIQATTSAMTVKPGQQYRRRTDFNVMTISKDGLWKPIDLTWHSHITSRTQWAWRWRHPLRQMLCHEEDSLVYCATVALLPQKRTGNFIAVMSRQSNARTLTTALSDYVTSMWMEWGRIISHSILQWK